MKFWGSQKLTVCCRDTFAEVAWSVQVGNGFKFSPLVNDPPDSEKIDVQYFGNLLKPLPRLIDI